MAQRKEYDVKLTRTTVEEATVTVEAPNGTTAAVRAALSLGHEAWQPKSVTVDVEQSQWKQGGEEDGPA